MYKEINLADIPGKRARLFNNAVKQDVEDFVKSGLVAAEVTITNYKTPESARAAYVKAIKTAHVDVEAMCRAGRLFLIRGGSK